MDKAWDLQPPSPELCNKRKAHTPWLEKASPCQRRRPSTAKHWWLINCAEEVWCRRAEGDGHPLQRSCLVGYSPWGRKEPGMTVATRKEKGGQDKTNTQESRNLCHGQCFGSLFFTRYTNLLWYNFTAFRFSGGHTLLVINLFKLLNSLYR